MYLEQINIKKISIILLSIIVSFSIIKYYKHHNKVQDQLAAKNYQLMLSAMSKEDLVTVKKQAANLVKINNNRTPYPRLAALFLAKIAVEEHNLDNAVANLRLIVKATTKDQIWHLANLRLIKVLLWQNKLSEVEAIKSNMEGKIPNSFATKYQELFGDLLLAKNQKQAAHLLYLDAVNNLPKQLPTTLLDLKLTETNLEND